MGREEKFASTGYVPPLACWVCYFNVLLGFVAFGAYPMYPDPYTNGLAASLFMTGYVWLTAIYYGNTSVYDPYWCFYPVILASCWMAAAHPTSSRRGWLALGLLVAWWSRYNVQWPWAGWTTGIQTEDWRYMLMARSVGLTDSVGMLYWVGVSLVGSHIVPTLLVWLVLGPAHHVWTADSGAAVLGARDVLGTLVSAGGVLLQYVSDAKLHAFREGNIPNSNAGGIETKVCCKTCREGPWAYSRHPNYLGEVLMWWGINIIASAGRSPVGTALSVAGCVGYYSFFRVSASLMDARSLRNRRGYQQVMDETSALLPCPLCVDRVLDTMLVRETPHNG